MASARKLSRRGFVQAGVGAGAILAARRAGAAPGKIEKPKLTLGLAVPAASFLPVYVAAARTWKEQGLEVEIVSFRGDAEVSQAMAGGSLDLSLQSLDGLINLIVANQPVKGFYAGFHQASAKSAHLDARTRELIALAVAVTAAMDASMLIRMRPSKPV